VENVKKVKLENMPEEKGSNAKLFEVGHPPVVMNKTLSCVIISFMLHQTI